MSGIKFTDIYPGYQADQQNPSSPASTASAALQSAIGVLPAGYWLGILIALIVIRVIYELSE